MYATKHIYINTDEQYRVHYNASISIILYANRNNSGSQAAVIHEYISGTSGDKKKKQRTNRPTLSSRASLSRDIRQLSRHSRAHKIYGLPFVSIKDKYPALAN